MSNFWIDRQGRSYLRGVEDDPNNPVALPEHLIIDFLQDQKKARLDLLAILPSMQGEEKDRIQSIIDRHPNIMKDQVYDQDREDQFQSKINDIRVNISNNHLPKNNKTSDYSQTKLIVRR